MRATRLAVTLLLLAGAAEASAQFSPSQYQPIEIPQVKYDMHQSSKQAYDQLQAQVGEMGKKTVDRMWIFVVGGLVAAVVFIGVAVLSWAAKSRATNDPVRLAMNDPWIRARIEAMSPREREEFVRGLR